MPDRSTRRPSDPNELAHRIFLESIGELPKVEPPVEPGRDEPRVPFCGMASLRVFAVVVILSANMSCFSSVESKTPYQPPLKDNGCTIGLGEMAAVCLGEELISITLKMREAGYQFALEDVGSSTLRVQRLVKEEYEDLGSMRFDNEKRLMRISVVWSKPTRLDRVVAGIVADREIVRVDLKSATSNAIHYVSLEVESGNEPCSRWTRCLS